MSKQTTRKFVTKILRKTCSSLVKIISHGENNFTQNRYNKLQRISAKNKWIFAKKSAKVQIWDHLQLCFIWIKKSFRLLSFLSLSPYVCIANVYKAKRIKLSQVWTCNNYYKFGQIILNFPCNIFWCKIEYL